VACEKGEMYLSTYLMTFLHISHICSQFIYDFNDLSVSFLFYLIVHVVMISVVVYFDVSCKCPVCIVLRWIVCVAVAVLRMWSSYVYLLY
jgi:hypothetical protein